MLTNDPGIYIRGRLFPFRHFKIRYLGRGSEGNVLISNKRLKQLICLKHVPGQVYPMGIFQVDIPGKLFLYKFREIHVELPTWTKIYSPIYIPSSFNFECEIFKFSGATERNKENPVTFSFNEHAMHRFPRLLTLREIIDDQFYYVSRDGFDEAAMCNYATLKRYVELIPGSEIFYVRDYSLLWEYVQENNLVLYKKEVYRGTASNINLMVGFNQYLGVPITKYYQNEVAYVDAEIKFPANDHLQFCIVTSGSTSIPYFEGLNLLEMSAFDALYQGLVRFYVDKESTEEELINQGFVKDETLSEYIYYFDGHKQTFETLVNHSRFKQDDNRQYISKNVVRDRDTGRGLVSKFNYGAGELYQEFGDPEIVQDYYVHGYLISNVWDTFEKEFEVLNSFSFEVSLNHNQGVNLCRPKPDLYSVESENTGFSSFKYDANCNWIETHRPMRIHPVLNVGEAIFRDERKEVVQLNYTVELTHFISHEHWFIYYLKKNNDRSEVRFSDPILGLASSDFSEIYRFTKIQAKQVEKYLKLVRVDQVASIMDKFSKISDTNSILAKYWKTTCLYLDDFLDLIQKAWYNRILIPKTYSIKRGSVMYYVILNENDVIANHDFILMNSVYATDGSTGDQVKIEITDTEESTVARWNYNQLLILNEHHPIDAIMSIDSTTSYHYKTIKIEPNKILHTFELLPTNSSTIQLSFEKQLFKYVYKRAAFLILRFPSRAVSTSWLWKETIVPLKDFIEKYPEYIHYIDCESKFNLVIPEMCRVGEILYLPFENADLSQIGNIEHITPITYAEDFYNIHFDREISEFNWKNEVSKHDVDIYNQILEWNVYNAYYLEKIRKIHGNKALHIHFVLETEICDSYPITSPFTDDYCAVCIAPTSNLLLPGNSNSPTEYYTYDGLDCDIPPGFPPGFDWGDTGSDWSAGSGGGSYIFPVIAWDWGYLPIVPVTINPIIRNVGEVFSFNYIAVPQLERLWRPVFASIKTEKWDWLHKQEVYPLNKIFVEKFKYYYHILVPLVEVSILKQSILRPILEEIHVKPLAPRAIKQTRFGMGQFNRFKDAAFKMKPRPQPLNQSIIAGINSKVFLLIDGEMSEFATWANDSGKRILINVTERYLNVLNLTERYSSELGVYISDSSLFNDIDDLIRKISLHRFYSDRLVIMIEPSSITNIEFPTFEELIPHFMSILLNRFGSSFKIEILINLEISDSFISKILSFPNFKHFIYPIKNYKDIDSIESTLRSMGIFDESIPGIYVNSFTNDDLDALLDKIQFRYGFDDVIIIDDSSLIIPEPKFKTEAIQIPKLTKETSIIFNNYIELGDVLVIQMYSEAFIYETLIEAEEKMNTYIPYTEDEKFNQMMRIDGCTRYLNSNSIPDSSDAKNWIFVSETNRYTLTSHSMLLNSILFNQASDRYSLEVTLYSNSEDNDFLGVIVAANLFDNCQEYIVVARTMGGVDPLSGYALMYINLRTNEIREIQSIDLGDLQETWRGYQCRIRVVRKKNLIQVITTRFVENEHDDDSFLGNSYSDNDYIEESLITLNLNDGFESFNGPKLFGFITYSQKNASFIDVKIQGILEDNFIYVAETNEIWEYSFYNEQWENTETAITEKFNDKFILHNPETNNNFIITNNEIKLLT